MSIGLQVWSQTASQNSTIDTNINWPEGMAPSQVNDSARATMASMAKWRDDNNGSIVTSGTTTAYTVTTSQVEAALTAGYTVVFQMHATNDTSATLAVDSLAAKPLQVIAGTNLQGGELLIGNIYEATYSTSGTGQWLIRNADALGSQANIVGTVNITNNAVTLPKLAQQLNNTVVANTSGSSAAPTAVTPSTLFDSTFGSSQGTILYRGASAWAGLAPGTSGQVLQTQGNSGNPQWVNVGSVLLNTYTGAASASLTSSDFSGTYSAYDAVFESVVPTTASLTAIVQFQVSGATQSSSYLVQSNSWAAGASAVFGTGITTGLIVCQGADVSTNAIGLNGTMRFYNPTNVSTGKSVTSGFTYLNASGNIVGINTHGTWKGAAAATGFVFSFETGTIASGTIKVYGIV